MGLLSDLIGIGGGLIGFGGAGRAAGAVSNADIAAEHGVMSATNSAQAGLGQAGQAANSTLTDYLHQQQSNAAPYVEGGKQGEQQLAAFAGQNQQFDPGSAGQFFNNPAYQFELGQGQNAIQNRASASGIGSSGQTLKDLTQYGQGLASTYYQQAFNNAQNVFNTNHNATLQNLTALAGTGEFGVNQSNQALQTTGARQSANDIGVAAQQGNWGMQGAKEAGDFAVGAGQARAGGILGQGNALASGGASLADLIGMGIPGLGGSKGSGGGYGITLGGG